MTTYRCRRCGNENKFGTSGMIFMEAYIDGDGEFIELASEIPVDTPNQLEPMYCAECNCSDIVQVTEVPVG